MTPSEPLQYPSHCPIRIHCRRHRRRRPAVNRLSDPRPIRTHGSAAIAGRSATSRTTRLIKLFSPAPTGHSYKPSRCVTFTARRLWRFLREVRHGRFDSAESRIIQQSASGPTSAVHMREREGWEPDARIELVVWKRSAPPQLVHRQKDNSTCEPRQFDTRQKNSGRWKLMRDMDDWGSALGPQRCCTMEMPRTRNVTIETNTDAGARK